MIKNLIKKFKCKWGIHNESEMTGKVYHENIGIFKSKYVTYKEFVCKSCNKIYWI